MQAPQETGAKPARPHVRTVQVRALLVYPGGVRPWCRLLVPLLGVVACEGQQAAQMSGVHVTTAATVTGASSTGGWSSTSGDGSGAGASTTAEDSQGNGSGTTVIFDVGDGPDVGDLQPPGCQGKIDFLFVMSRQPFVTYIQEQLVAAFPKFIETIETKFADFDYHIMVIDGDPEWGLVNCDEECPFADPQPACGVPEYPCELLDTVTACDRTLGAGIVFNAGAFAPNKPCGLAGDERFLTRDHPDLVETFACVAQVGSSGRDWLGEALTAALSPELRQPGGCNAGFLRDDALLVVTLVSESPDYYSDGTPADWAQAVLDAKHGDSASIVMLGIVDQLSPEWCEMQTKHRLCDLISRFPYHLTEDCDVPDYGPAFDQAMDLVETACAQFIPG